MPAERAAGRGLVLVLAAAALAACGRVTPAPVPENGAAISPGTPTMVLVPADAAADAATPAPLAPVVVPTSDGNADEVTGTTTPDLVGPAGDLGGGGGGTADDDEDDEDEDQP